MGDIHVGMGRAIAKESFRQQIYSRRRKNQYDEPVRLASSLSSLDSFLRSGGRQIRLDEHNIVKLNKILFSQECWLSPSGEVSRVSIFKDGGLVDRAGKEVAKILDEYGQAVLKNSREFHEILGTLAFDHHLSTWLQELASAGETTRLWEELKEKTGADLTTVDPRVIVRLVNSGAVYYFYRVDYFGWKIIDNGGVQCLSTNSMVVNEAVVSRCSVSYPGPVKDEMVFLHAAAQNNEGLFAAKMRDLGLSNLAEFLADSALEVVGNFVGAGSIETADVENEDFGNWVPTEWDIQKLILGVEEAGEDEAAIASLARDFAKKHKGYTSYPIRSEPEPIFVPNADLGSNFNLNQFLLEVSEDKYNALRNQPEELDASTTFSLDFGAFELPGA